MHYGYVTECQF